jgi:hypothetical protein
VVCLHCRHAAHLVVAAKRRRTAGAVAVAFLAISALVSSTVMALKADPATDLPAVASVPAAEAAGAPAEPAAVPAPTAPAVVPDAPLPETEEPAAPAAAFMTAGPTTPGVRLMVAEGRTPLGGGMVAVRSGDTVTVHFDQPGTRTRRADKFERVLRTTLPVVYGPLAEAALAALPDGQLVRAGDLLTALPMRGVRLRTADGATLAVWPQTRPGRDGPLVVTYLATIER